ncbi:hypothetical protein [Caproiciproducens sp.]|uniref:hypothetical protein n=1 Tax=Caproiciproducens sp. TaxID=1954376 RepID=UPI00289C3B77|nr:hypothetical protein [Caproiciproducens sp.]
MAIGDILREFNVPAQASGNGRGIAFDGTALYTTITASTDIFKMDLNGNYLATIPSAHVYGALYYDALENVFWGGGYEGLYTLYKVALNGTVLQTINYQSIIPAALLSQDPFPAYVDGITVDPATNTIWFSTDLGSNVYNISKAGVYIGFIPAPLPNSGVTTDGTNLWLAFADNPTPILKKLSTTGTELETVDINVTGQYQIEDIEYDSVTFAPKCAVWAINATFDTPVVRAIEVPCNSVSRFQAITDMIESVALEQTALSHILNAEGEKLQRFLPLAGNDQTLVLKANRSVESTINSISRLELVLQGKLGIFNDCLCPPATDDLLGGNSRKLLASLNSDPAFAASKPPKI